MKIGFLATTTISEGGVYQYTQSLLESLVKYSNYNYLIINNKKNTSSTLENELSNHQFIKIDIIASNVLLKLKKIIYISFPISRHYLNVSSNYNILKKYKLDLIINPIISLTPIYINKPYIVTIHDLQHKYYPNFFTLKERLQRNYFYKNAALNALFVVCESQAVKRDIIKFLGIPSNKIRVIPAPPPSYLVNLKIKNYHLEEIKTKYLLPEKFLFYPAHFWYHKNHLNLIRAIKLIRKKYKEAISLVFIGLKENNFKTTMNEIKNLGLEGQVRYLGYVREEDIRYLYKLSTALVMPTLFESVSMPIWEAFYLGVPVICSNVCALPKQVGDAGLLFDPNNIEDMAEKIYKIWINENLRASIIKKGHKRVQELTLENYAKQWEKIIDETLKKI